ncbi:MAG: hypothetical protein ACO1NZ_03655 [Adhaeribacter sp.]
MKFSPLALLDLNTPVIQLGPQVSFRRFAISGEFGFAFPALQQMSMKRSDSMFVDQRHHKIRLETKYYLGVGKSNGFAEVNPYLSIEGFWVPRTFRRYNGLLGTDTGTYRYDYSDISRDVQGGCVKFGIEPMVYRRWLIDAFWGIGVRQIRVVHQAVGLEPEIIGWHLFSRADDREGTYYRPHLALGFKIGYVLNQGPSGSF